MPGPEMERARQLLEQGNLSPQVRSALERKMREYEAETGGGPADAVQVRQAGEPAPDVDPLVLREKAFRATAPEAPGPSEDELLQREYGGPAGMAQAGAQSMARGMTLGLSDAASAALTGAVHAATGGDEGPTLTPEARSRALELGIEVPEEESGFSQGFGAAREHQKGLQEANPITSGVGELAGALMPGGLAMRVGKGAVQAGRGAQAALSPALGAGGARVAGDVTAGALGGAAVSGGHALVEQGMGEDVSPGMQAMMGAGAGAVLSPILGGLGRYAQRSLRDPAKQAGRDLTLIEAGIGKTSPLNAVEPGPAIRELAEEARLTPGMSPQGVATKRAYPELGRELQGQMDDTLGAIKAENQAMYASGEQASLRPMVKRQMQELRRMAFEDGTPLPGNQPAVVAKELRNTARVRVVPRNSEEVALSDPELHMEVGLAKKLGLVRGGASQQADQEMVVILEPRDAPAEAIDTMTRAIDARAGAKAGNYDPAKIPFKQLAGGAREAREGLGNDWAATKARQSQRLGEMKNRLEASGLPRESEAVDLADVGTRNSLAGAVRKFRTTGNEVSDEVLEQLASENERLRKLLDDAAGAGAFQRLRGQGDVADVARSARGWLPSSIVESARLRLDPLMGVFAGPNAIPRPRGAPGVVPVAGGQAARAGRRIRDER